MSCSCDVPNHPSAVVPFELPESLKEVVTKRMELIEGLMARSMIDLGYPPGALTLYEESKPAHGLAGTVLYKWWVGVDTVHTPAARPEFIIKNFLVKAREHYDAEVDRLAVEYRDNPASAHAKKALEGARWTVYHTKRLLEFLEQKGPML